MKKKKVPTWLFLLIVTIVLVPNFEILVRGASQPVRLILIVSTISLAASLFSLALGRQVLAHWTVIIGAALGGAAVIIS
jgi:hypothetical protein